VGFFYTAPECARFRAAKLAVREGKLAKPLICETEPSEIPYKNKYWRGIKFGELANRHAIAKFKSRQYIFFTAYQL